MKACVFGLTALALLTGCTVQPAANGGFRLSTISLGQALGQASAGAGGRDTQSGGYNTARRRCWRRWRHRGGRR